jgi:hypothetical protein
MKAHRDEHLVIIDNVTDGPDGKTVKNILKVGIPEHLVPKLVRLILSTVLNEADR